MGVWRAANPRLRSVGSFAGAGTSDQIICPICRHTEHEPSVWVGPGKVARPSVSGSGQHEEAGLRSEAGLSATDVGPSTRGPERAEVCFLAPECGLLLGSGAEFGRRAAALGHTLRGQLCVGRGGRGALAAVYCLLWLSRRCACGTWSDSITAVLGVIYGAGAEHAADAIAPRTGDCCSARLLTADEARRVDQQFQFRGSKMEALRGFRPCCERQLDVKGSGARRVAMQCG